MLQEIDDNYKWNVAPLSYHFGNGINFQLEVENPDEIYNNFESIIGMVFATQLSLLLGL